MLSLDHQQYPPVALGPHDLDLQEPWMIGAKLLSTMLRLLAAIFRMLEPKALCPATIRSLRLPNYCPLPALEVWAPRHQRALERSANACSCPAIADFSHEIKQQGPQGHTSCLGTVDPEEIVVPEVPKCTMTPPLSTL